MADDANAPSKPMTRFGLDLWGFLEALVEGVEVFIKGFVRLLLGSSGS